MSFHLPSGVHSLTGNGGLFSDVAAIRRRQISRIKAYMNGERFDAKKNRALRKAEYKAKLARRALPENLAQAIKANPMRYGAPRSFKILNAGHDVAMDAKLHDYSRYIHEGHTLYFAAFGIPGKPVRLNDVWIKPTGNELSPDKRVYTLSTTDENGDHVGIYLDFTLIDAPTGYIEKHEGQYAVKLEPGAVSFNVSVSTNAGAYKSTGKQTLMWDEISTEWANATWEPDTMIFSYDTALVNNPLGGSMLVNEVAYQDLRDRSEVFEMDAARYGRDYTCIMSMTDAIYCVTTINTRSCVPPPPEVRVNDNIKSVFPILSIFKFDELGINFTGAYIIPNSTQVYAVKGTGIASAAVIPGPGPIKPIDGRSPSLGSSLGSCLEKSSKLFHSAVKPIAHVFKGDALPNPLPVTGLLNNDPMVPDANSPTGYTDSISTVANKDFHDIVCYYMDDDIHKLFVSASPTILDPSILAIATDSGDNAAFYKTLQAGTNSLPLSWSVTPALPSFLRFADPAVDEGSIEQVPGVAATLLSPTIYTVTASITILGREFTRTSDVTISVISATPCPSSTTMIEVSEKDGVGFSSEISQPWSSGAIPRENASNGYNSENKQPSQVYRTGSNPMVDTEVGNTGTSDSVPKDVTDDYQKLMESAPPFFKWQQDQSLVMNQHYTVNAAILKMQHALVGSWWAEGGNQAFEDLFFPNPPPAPPPGVNDSLNYQGAANSFVSQCIYNGDGYVHDRCNFNATQAAIDNFNHLLWQTNTQRFVDWLQWSGSFLTTGGLCPYQDYRDVLMNKFWIAYKLAEQTSGEWANQSMEMYFRFLKLTAIGATPEQINEIYNYLTVPNPDHETLQAGGFSDITPSKWMSYTGYMLQGGISYDQLGVQNLGHQWTHATATGGGDVVTVTYHADTEFLGMCGFSQSPPSGCCFRAGTRVVLDDSKTTVPIEDVRPGQKILSPTQNDAHATRTVQYVSCPSQARRPLFSFRHMSDVQFTDTHPMIRNYDEDRSPIVGFVNVGAALQVNLLWGAFHLQQIPRGDLVEIAPKEQDETLLDLVMDQWTPGDSVPRVPTFVIQTAEGKRLTVCSEAADVAAMPATTRFILAFASAIGKANNVKKFFPEGLSVGVLDYAGRIRRYRAAIADQVTSPSDCQKQLAVLPHTLDMPSAISVLGQAGQGQVSPQALADATEAVTAVMGLSLQSQLDDGWQFTSTAAGASGMDEDAAVLSTHLIQLTQPDVLELPEHVVVMQEKLVKKLGSLLSDTSSGVSITVALGSSAAAARKAQGVAVESLGPRLHRLHAIIPMKAANDQPYRSSIVQDPPTGYVINDWDAPGVLTSYSLILTIDSQLTLSAQGSVVPDVEARWPLHLTSIGIDGEEGLKMSLDTLQHWHVGWISVSGASVRRETLKRAESWTKPAADGMSPMEVYGELLGRKVGEDVVESVLGH